MCKLEGRLLKEIINAGETTHLCRMKGAPGSGGIAPLEARRKEEGVQVYSPALTCTHLALGFELCVGGASHVAGSPPSDRRNAGADCASLFRERLSVYALSRSIENLDGPSDRPQWLETNVACCLGFHARWFRRRSSTGRSALFIRTCRNVTCGSGGGSGGGQR